MRHLEILLPFSLPPPELARDLLRELQLPALASLLGHASAAPTAASGDAAARSGFERALPHETWLAHRFGMADGLKAGGSPPVAAALMRHLELPITPGHWFIVEPVHFHIARDHLVLADPRQLELTEAEARSLYDSAVPSFAECGMTLLYGTADYWFAHADAHRTLQTATPDATCGHNIDIWMPQGDSARAWRKLQNTLQMDWHAHPVNIVRAARGAVPTNSVWLWGGSTVPEPVAQADLPAVFGLHGWMRAFGDRVPLTMPAADAAALLAAPAADGLLVLDALLGPALNSDWAEWRDQLQTLETRWFAPLLAALSTGKIAGIACIMTDAARLQRCTTTRTALRKFWRRPSLAGLLP